jgi:membrane fusion protein, multidrug efflux system
MKQKTLIFAGLMTLLAVGWFWFAGQHFRAGSQPKAEDSDAGPIAKVRVVPLNQKTIVQTIPAYGTVIASPEGAQTIVAPFECRIRRVRATSGERIETGDILIEVAPSPETYLLLETARSAFQLSQKELENTQERFDLKLVTNQELLQAQQAFQEAQLRLSSLKGRGLGRDGKIKAPFSGIISKVAVQEGSLVTTGGLLLEISADNKLEARLGIEPEDMPLVKVGQPVSLEPVSRRGITPLSAQIRLISRSVDQTTGLVDVFVPLPATGGILLGDYLKVQIEVASKKALVVPRKALLPAGDHQVIFTINDGHAVKHVVQTGLESGDAIEVICADLHPGDDVVVQGNYELADGMAIQVESAS